MPALRKRVARLYNELEKISDEHDEVTDSDVRACLQATLNYYFVWGMARDSSPVCYAMYSAEGDAAVAAAVNSFLDDAIPMAQVERVGVGKPRLKALQDLAIETARGETYDLYIGDVGEEPLESEPPADFQFEPGDFDDDDDEE